MLDYDDTTEPGDEFTPADYTTADYASDCGCAWDEVSEDD
jgi:hypothetical protein